MTLLFIAAVTIKRIGRDSAQDAVAETAKTNVDVESGDTTSESVVDRIPAVNNPLPVKNAKPESPARPPQRARDVIPAEPPLVAIRPPRAKVAFVDEPPLPAGDLGENEANDVAIPDDEPVVAVRPDRGAPPKPVDVDAALAFRIVRFEQLTPASIGDLLQQVEEMAGVPIIFDKDELQSASIDLGAEVRLELEGTTVGGILEALLTQAGLIYHVEQGTIRLRPESADSKARTSATDSLTPER
jgi:hypothetical protein